MSTTELEDKFKTFLEELTYEEAREMVEWIDQPIGDGAGQFVNEVLFTKFPQMETK